VSTARIKTIIWVADPEMTDWTAMTAKTRSMAVLTQTLVMGATEPILQRVAKRLPAFLKP
jgi:hypothetical protein